MKKISSLEFLYGRSADLHPDKWKPTRGPQITDLHLQSKTDSDFFKLSILFHRNIFTSKVLRTLITTEFKRILWRIPFRSHVTSASEIGRRNFPQCPDSNATWTIYLELLSILGSRHSNTRSYNNINEKRDRNIIFTIFVESLSSCYFISNYGRKKNPIKLNSVFQASFFQFSTFALNKVQCKNWTSICITAVLA